jgi:hypothetical protein
VDQHRDLTMGQDLDRLAAEHDRGDAMAAMRPMTKIIELWLLAAVVDRLWVPRPNIVPLQPLVGLCQRKSTAIRLDVHLVGWNASFPSYRSA